MEPLGIELTTEDIKRICGNAQSVLGRTGVVCSSSSLPDLDAHQTELENAMTGLEQVANYIGKQIDGLKNSEEAVSSMYKDLKRHQKRTTRSYWLTKDSLPKSL